MTQNNLEQDIKEDEVLNSDQAIYEDQKHFQIYLTERSEQREDYYRGLEYYKQNDEMYLDLGVNLENRTIDIDSDITSDSTAFYKRVIRILETRDEESPICINIQSTGGSVYDGLGLYGVLRNCKCPIHTFCEGYAMSMAVIIFIAGDVRDCYPESTFMVHEVSGGALGKNNEIKADSVEMDRLNSLLCRLLSARTEMNIGWWKEEIKHTDKFYTKQQAKKLGIL